MALASSFDFGIREWQTSEAVDFSSRKETVENHWNRNTAALVCVCCLPPYDVCMKCNYSGLRANSGNVKSLNGKIAEWTD